MPYSQNLTGTTLIIQEPYACLFHHMADFEHFIASEGDRADSDHAQILLEFLRPQYEQYYIPALERSLTVYPTVMFDDLWIIMRPGSLAYTSWNGHKIGCVLGKSVHLPPTPSRDLPEAWSIYFWFLQVHWSSDHIGCTMHNVVIDRFDGEMPLTSLAIHPVKFVDTEDQARTRQRFIDRGRKVYDILCGNSMPMDHDGECMDNSKQSYKGRIVVGGVDDDDEELYPDHDWQCNWVSPSQLMQKDPSVPLSEIKFMVDPKTDPPNVLTVDYLFILSPCLSALRLLSNDWSLITVENTRPIIENDEDPSLIVDEPTLEMILAMVNVTYDKNAPQLSLSRNGLSGSIIHLHGPPGIEKQSMIELISQRSRRPLLTIDVGELLGLNINDFRPNLARWLSTCTRLKAVMLIDNFDEFMQKQTTPYRLVSAFIQALSLFEGVIILSTSRVQEIDQAFHPFISLDVSVPELDDEKRKSIWVALEKKIEAEEKIRLHKNATKFLESPDAQIVNWHAHEITRCFKIAVALAAKHAIHSQETVVIVEDDHFKEAMNIVHWSRRFTAATQPEVRDPYRRPRIRTGARPLRNFESDTSDDLLHRRTLLPPRLPRRSPDMDDNDVSDAQSETNRQVDSGLCIPDLNRIEWDAFRSAGERELFRKTSYHAIDILKGEPLITLRNNNQRRPKRQDFAPKKLTPSTTILGAANQDGQKPKASEPSKTTLPERIRINSPAIIKAFSEICGEDISQSSLLFRPFRSLIYYEQGFRDLINREENTLQEQPMQDKPTEEGADNKTGKEIALSRLKQLKCLTSFIENDIKPKQKYLASSRCQSVSFADVPMLFSLGEAVISKDHKQVYQVIKLSCIRHRVKSREKTGLDFLKDESEVEFENNPVFVHCIHLDFDGKVMGPISHLFVIQRYDGEREVTSLPVFPLRHAKENGLRERLIERGKMFFKVISVKHMHYTGLTLKTRDDIDSQVVIDFEEAINRHSQWKPPIKSILEEFSILERFSQNEAIPTDKADDPDLRTFMEAQKSMRRRCINECCAGEPKHYDEYVEDLEKEDYIVAQMNRTAPPQLPVTVVPYDFRDIMRNNNLTDAEYLIMSHRVFGFVLRSRKWHELDMAYVFEVATLGAGEGFDELVLPPGHGDMVKSMIRQHLRDKKLSSINRDKTDVVRGKGRGLILLLHGVPGVGKTSTAECVADLFRRPLFQITSGDLGTTAKEVEDALEENFSLASRWNSILLIDEADVFLAERTKEDFVRNSLVAVFLRMMEYYAGVLFLTTNRVGVFDEAFTSRIHISLYYPPLDQKSTLQIFQKNWDRINTRYKEAGRVIDIDTLEITAFAIEYFENNKEGRWNGRQIRNAFQSALALAELDALGKDDFLGEFDHNRPVVLGRKSFDTVADAYKGFTSYLKQVYGADFARRARENLWRFDAFGTPRMPNSLSTRLKINEPAMPPPPPPPSGQWQGQLHAGYDPRYQQPYYPPHQQYAESYDHHGQRHPYPPTSRPFPYHDSKERQDPGTGAGNIDQ
ncbi:hypothetical protein F4679DRAFT_562689 [Xylaria curta]|nr:hypothetical protein F4679DRAFT_562689 [Xylaria curta]